MRVAIELKMANIGNTRPMELALRTAKQITENIYLRKYNQKLEIDMENIIQKEGSRKATMRQIIFPELKRAIIFITLLMEIFIREMGDLMLEESTGEIYLSKLTPGNDSWKSEFKLDTEELINAADIADGHQKLIESESKKNRDLIKKNPNTFSKIISNCPKCGESINTLIKEIAERQNKWDKAYFHELNLPFSKYRIEKYLKDNKHEDKLHQFLEIASKNIKSKFYEEGKSITIHKRKKIEKEEQPQEENKMEEPDGASDISAIVHTSHEDSFNSIGA